MKWVGYSIFPSNNRFIRGPYVIPKNMSLHLFEYLLKYPYKVSQKKPQSTVIVDQYK